ncbi:MAG: hypothetical protein ACI9FR_002638 [Cryomorphaceae bacterium]|jgi:hypothetical protein
MIIFDELKTTFSSTGYAIINTNLDEAVLDGAIADLNPYFGADRQHPIHVPYADNGRVQDGWHISQNVLKVAQCPAIIEAIEGIYNAKARPFQTLNFYKGTEQRAHVDSIHFNSEPFGAMCGVWVALEDIGQEQGPLAYHSGSNRLPEMNYDYFDLESSSSNYDLYLECLHEVIDKNNFSLEHATIKKGQALIWAANTIHGGAKQTNKELTRYSQVTHYYLGGAKAWRPSESTNSRFYFKPDWVQDVSNKPYKYPLPDPTFSQRVFDKLKRTFSGK